jgi:hypothetical protein
MEKGNDGQHRSSPGPASSDTGQRQVTMPGAHVGQKSGGEQQMDVSGCPNKCLTDTETKVG